MSRLAKILLTCSLISFLSFVIVRSLLGWVPFCWLALGFFAILAIFGFWVDRRFFAEFLSMKTTKQGLSMGTMILLVTVTLVAVNFIGARRYLTWDFSMNRVNSLSDQSVKLIKNLQSDLKVIYFYKEGTEGVEENRRRFIDLIRKYQDQSPKVKLEFVEVNKNPALAEKYNIKRGTQSVILDYQGKTNLIEKIDEQEITGALVKVTREKQPVVYLLSGHGELAVEQQADGASLSFLKQVLEGNQYQVKELSFNEKAEVPSDADVVMILGPQQEFLDLEIKALENYLTAGGSLFLAAEPRARHGLDSFLKRFGVRFSNTFVVTVMDTPFGRAIDPRRTRGGDFSTTSPITKPFGKNEFTAFVLPQAILREGTEAPRGITLEDIVRTSESSLAFESNQFDKDAGRGPFSLVTSVKGKLGDGKEAKEFTMIVAGDKDFISDAALYSNLNRDLVLNSLSYLAKDENMISITPKEVARTQMELPSMQFGLFIFLFLIPLPLLFYITGGVLWFRRRYS